MPSDLISSISIDNSKLPSNFNINNFIEKTKMQSINIVNSDDNNEIRATLLVNFGQNNPKNRKVIIDDTMTTLTMLITTLEFLLRNEEEYQKNIKIQ